MTPEKPPGHKDGKKEIKEKPTKRQRQKEKNKEREMKRERDLIASHLYNEFGLRDEIDSGL